jgi:hypothetical protein
MLIGRCKDRGFQTMSSPGTEMRSSFHGSFHGSIRRISTGVHLSEGALEKSAKPWLIAVDFIAGWTWLKVSHKANRRWRNT